ncbi:MAG: nucleotide exchange factor GrpE [Candidatus Doudnabacteria bacterium]|nr:nucleotide exchange factor GrpE [Candidatus Doudnabacteria bacterium]
MSDDIQQDDQNQASDVSLEKLQADFESAMAGWKRTAADFENFKKQKERENKELLEFAKEVTVVKLLPTIDTLEQALKHLPQYQQSADSNLQTDFEKQYQNWQTGVNGIVIQLDKVLSDLGVKKIEAIGKKFDPNFHEAIKEVESEKDDGIVIDEFQSGFELNGKVIRPSQVVISKKAAEGGKL